MLETKIIGAVAKTTLIHKLSNGYTAKKHEKTYGPFEACVVANLPAGDAISSLLLDAINALFQMLLLETWESLQVAIEGRTPEQWLSCCK